jgi:hypothetical protein
MSLIAMPTDPPAPKSIEWMLVNTIGSVISPFSLQRQIFNWAASTLRASLSYAPMTNGQALKWIAFLCALQGMSNQFLFGDPSNVAPQNPAASGGTVTGSGQTGYSLVTSSSGLTPGDWIQITATVQRLYRVTSVSGGTLGIWPQLRESPPGGTAIVIANTQGTFRLTANEQKLSENESKVYGITFECEEAI